MNVDAFSRRVQAVRDRMMALEHLASISSAPDQPLLIDAFELLRATVTELNLAEEALRSQDGATTDKSNLDIILSGIRDGVTLQDHTGRLLYANDAAARIVGYPSAQALQAAPLAEIMSRFAVMDESDEPFSLDRLPGRLALQGAPSPEAIVRFRVLATGEEYWSLVKATPVFDEQGQVQLAINVFHDISAIKRADTELQARVRQQAAVAEFGQRALMGNDLDTLLDTTVALVARTLEVEYCKVLERLPSGVLRLRAGVGWRAGLVGRATMTWTDSHAGYTLATNEPVIIDDLRAETRFNAPLLNDHGVISGMSVIIGQLDQPFGVLGAYSARHQTFTDDDVLFLRAIASALAAAIVRRHAEEALHEQREWLEVTLSSIGDAVIATDTAGRVAFMNSVAESLTGWTRDAAQGQELATVFQIINEQTRQVVESPIARVLREGVIVGLANHTILVARDGAERPIDDSGAPIHNENGALIGVVLVFRDITERRRAEKAQHFLDQASAVLADSLNYELTLARVARLVVPQLADWCAVDVITEDGPIQRLAVEHVDPTKVAWAQDLQRHYPSDPDAPRGVPQVLRSGRAELYAHIPDAVLVATARDPEHLQLLRAIGFSSAMIVPLLARDRTLGAITFVTAESGRHYDMDDLALAEELAHRAALAVDNARLYREAQAAIRVRDQFLSLASHELKTPLTVLLGNAQLLQRRSAREGHFSERNQRALGVISMQAVRLNKMIESLLNISRIEIGQLSIEHAPLDLCELAGRVVAEVQPALDHHTLECHTPDEPLIIMGDALRLEQVLQNLIGNAIKYSPAGGPITIQVERRGAMACVAVTDEGIGIPEAALPKLFSRFYRASNVNPQQIAGMGIGLYVIKEIVALHGGEVTVTSTEGVGSTFTVCLPPDAPDPVG